MIQSRSISILNEILFSAGGGRLELPHSENPSPSNLPSPLSPQSGFQFIIMGVTVTDVISRLFASLLRTLGEGVLWGGYFAHLKCTDSCRKKALFC